MDTQQDELKQRRRAALPPGQTAGRPRSSAAEIGSPSAHAAGTGSVGDLGARIGSVRQEIFALVEELRSAANAPRLQAAADEMQAAANRVGRIQALAGGSAPARASR